jgi:hypothetical protein
MIGRLLDDGDLRKTAPNAGQEKTAGTNSATYRMGAASVSICRPLAATRSALRSARAAPSADLGHVRNWSIKRRAAPVAIAAAFDPNRTKVLGVGCDTLEAQAAIQWSKTWAASSDASL